VECEESLRCNGRVLSGDLVSESTGLSQSCDACSLRQVAVDYLGQEYGTVK